MLHITIEVKRDYICPVYCFAFFSSFFVISHAILAFPFPLYFFFDLILPFTCSLNYLFPFFFFFLCSSLLYNITFLPFFFTLKSFFFIYLLNVCLLFFFFLLILIFIFTLPCTKFNAYCLLYFFYVFSFL